MVMLPNDPALQQILSSLQIELCALGLSPWTSLLRSVYVRSFGIINRFKPNGFFLSKLFGRVHFLFKGVWLVFIGIFPVGILYKFIAGRYRPVRVTDGPITARYRFIKNASWVVLEMSELNANSVVPDQTPGCAAADKVPHCSHYV